MNKAVKLASRPLQNTSVALENFAVRGERVPRGSIIFKTLYMSVDPYMRCRFNISTGVDYTKPYDIDGPIYSAAIAKVISSDFDKYKPGDLYLEFFDAWPWKEIVAFNDESELKNLRKINPWQELLFPMTLRLGTVGTTGLSAFFGIIGELNQDKVKNVQ